ncbi:glycoside hydrolase family 65 protein [Streptomyces canus]|uniref:glycoside hydrolase family 65 protein n=1 Tax=Streptomyces canus TaxID=58343 RepID=UPI002E258F7F
MSEWTWAWKGYDPAAEQLRESLCTLGNGYFATRGAVPECRAGLVHYPGTYAAGCYNRPESTVAGRQVVNEDLVNLPNWLLLRFRLRRAEGAWSPWFAPRPHTLLAHRHTLDLRRGTLTRTFRHRDERTGVVAVEQTRLVHMGDPHLAALRTVFTAEDWSGEVEIESCLDGEVTNGNVHRYRALNGHQLTQVRTGAREPHTVWLTCRTSTSDIGVAMAARTIVTDRPPALSELRPARHRAVHRLVLPLAPGRPVAVEKTVALHTSRDTAISDPLGAAVDRLSSADDFAGLLNSHVAAWDRLWRRAEIQVPGQSGRVLRFHLFHLLQTLSPHTADLDAGVPARGLHGEAYRGHVFWDELFVLPHLNLHFPEVSRALLNYRYRRLPRACEAAAAIGRSGAMYPWQSGSDGREETQEWHLNPRSGRWLPDHSRLQHHVGSAIAYNVWQYCEATGDTEFLHTRGAEMLLQIARFWADLAAFDPATERYHIRGVVGPDEYHDSYPGAAQPGLNDNAYTNVTAAWVLGRALDLLRRLPAWRREELRDRIRLNLGAMAGTLDLVQRGLTGLETREDALWLDPVPLPALSEYGFSLRYRGHWGVGIRRLSGQLQIGVPDSEESAIRVVLADRAVTIAPGETCTLVLKADDPSE